MSRITRSEVEYIARLAHLSLSDREAEGMTRDLEAILDYVTALEELDTTDIEPTAHAIALATPLRDDQAIAGLDPERVVSNAPKRAGTAFVVPKVIEGGES
jgi:aspartyl-tRNA(Asn)/glutamyl-tRNA(Gln) amidotransferase subunit C